MTAQNPKKSVLWLPISAMLGVVVLAGAGIWYVVRPDEFPDQPTDAAQLAGQPNSDVVDRVGKNAGIPTKEDSPTQPTGDKAGSPVNSDEVRLFARKILERRGVRFEDDSSFGGLFADYGLIRGEVKPSHFHPLLKFPEITGIRLPEGASDGAIEKIRQLPNLKGLSITGKGITDEGLIRLAKAPSLEKLFIRSQSGVGFTEAGLKRFKLARPECTVDKGW